MHQHPTAVKQPTGGRPRAFTAPGDATYGLDLVTTFRPSAPVDVVQPEAGAPVAGAGRSTESPATGAVSRLEPRAGTSRRRSTDTASCWSARYRRRVLVTDLVVIGSAAAAGSLLAADRPVWLALALQAGVLVLLWTVVLQVFRTRSPRRMAVGADEYKRVVGATAATAGIVAVASLLLLGTGAVPVVRPYLVVALPAGLAGLMVGRWAWRTWLHHLRIRGVALSDVVVVGEPADVAYVIRQVARRSAVAYRVVGVVLDGVDDAGTWDDGEGRFPSTGARDAGSAPPSLPAFRGTGRVPEVVRRLGADAVIVAGPLQEGNSAIRALGWALEPSRTELILVSSLVNVAGPRITMRPMEGLPLMHVEQPRFEGGRHVLKRGLDIVVSSVALVLMLPLFAVIAVAVRRDSEGGVFFSQIRTGRRGRPFRMYKFRTMVATAEQDRLALAAQNEAAGPLFKLRKDPRVTRVGAFLRRHSLDELPQFWNVLRGDMSLVGPRPPLPEEVATYEGDTGRRLYIKPGLTGLWQISGRSNLDWEESVRLDLYYVENWSVTGDLMIMWRTFKVMVQPEGAY